MNPATDLAGRRLWRLKIATRPGSDERWKATWNRICGCGKAAVIVGYILRVALLDVSDRPSAANCGQPASVP
jgi:hypothetical protein